MQYTPSVLDCHIDWLTLTNNDPKNLYGLANLGKELVTLCISNNYTADPWHWCGYSGESTPHCRWGEREDSAILQISGPMADDWFDAAYLQATNCSRIDLAVTVRYEPEREGIAGESYGNGKEWADKRGTGPGYTLITNSSGGSSCYVGARISDLYGRIYDKYRESADERYRGCWRWEVEAKGEIAKRCASAVHSSPTRASAIGGTVWRYFARRGCEPDWRMGDDELPLLHIRPASNVATKLQWLERQVSPTVRFLLERGYESAAIEALGLAISAQERERIKRLGRYGHHHNELDEE